MCVVSVWPRWLVVVCYASASLVVVCFVAAFQRMFWCGVLWSLGLLLRVVVVCAWVAGVNLLKLSVCCMHIKLQYKRISDNRDFPSVRVAS